MKPVKRQDKRNFCQYFGGSNVGPLPLLFLHDKMHLQCNKTFVTTHICQYGVFNSLFLKTQTRVLPKHVLNNLLLIPVKTNEPRHAKTNQLSVRQAKTQISLGIRPVHSDSQADLSLRWAHSHFVGFVMSRLICFWFPWKQMTWHNLASNFQSTNNNNNIIYSGWRLLPNSFALY